MRNRETYPPALISSELSELTDRAYDALWDAAHARSVSERYVLAQQSALRAAAALLSRLVPRREKNIPRHAWKAMAQARPELAETAAFFEETARRSRAVSAGLLVVNAREADDLVREAETFFGQVLALVGLPPRLIIEGLTPVEAGR